MVGIYIFLLLSFCLLFILTRTLWIKLEKNDIFKLEFHLPIFALELSKSKEFKPKNTRIRKNRRLTLPVSAYPRILSALINLLESSDMEIRRANLPAKNNSEIYKYHTVFFTFIAYLKAKVKKLSIKNDAFILSPDITQLTFDVTIKTRLYRFLLGCISVFVVIIKDKLKGINYVGK